MIARPKVSQIEWKTIELGAWQSWKFLTLFLPRRGTGARGGRAANRRRRGRDDDDGPAAAKCGADDLLECVTGARGLD